jgi:murein tripeptide amidase MpaA
VHATIKVLLVLLEALLRKSKGGDNIAMPYLNVDEVESAIATLAQTYPNTCQLIELQHRTTEGRICHALNVGQGLEQSSKPAVLFTGAVHAREWGGSEICVYFAADILEAYTRKTGLRYEGEGKGKYFTADQVRSLIDGLNVLIFPCVNPDGRHYSQTVEPLWRRNRNAANSGGNPDCVGVDLNRNYDFLWDFPNLFHPDAIVRVSTDPCDPNQTYHGSEPFSEQETKNVLWLLDNYPTIKWHIDIHSFSQLILHCWGDDENQSVNPEMNFSNPRYNRMRGNPDDEDYKEYVHEDDLSSVTYLANRMHDGIKGVNGNEYKVQSAFELYATAGTGQDYSHSRHFSNNGKNRVFGFTIEFGTEFHPPWEEMEHIVREVDAGLLEFCLAAAEQQNKSK